MLCFGLVPMLLLNVAIFSVLFYFTCMLAYVIFPLCLKDDAVNKFIAFSGEGQSLRKKGRKP